jgi:hypothetical protein
MRHERLFYELDNHTCLTSCPHRIHVKIGSSGCKHGCPYNNGDHNSGKEYWVYCTFPVEVNNKEKKKNMGKAKENAFKKFDYEILFKDSPDYYVVKNAKFLIEGTFVRFICFEGDEISHDEYYPTQHIHRIKRYYK